MISSRGPCYARERHAPPPFPRSAGVPGRPRRGPATPPDRGAREGDTAISNGRIGTDLSPAERIALASDLWSAVDTGRADVADFLRLAEGLKDERELAVLEIPRGSLEAIRNCVELKRLQGEGMKRWLASRSPAQGEDGVSRNR